MHSRICLSNQGTDIGCSIEFEGFFCEFATGSKFQGAHLGFDFRYHWNADREFRKTQTDKEWNRCSFRSEGSADPDPSFMHRRALDSN